MEIGKELAKALLGFQSEALDIKKSADNPFFKSKYAPLDEIIPAIRGAMKKYGLVFLQVPQGSDELVTTICHAESGQSVSGTLKMTPKDASPQGHGSAITYGRRYALVSMLGLNTEGDDDGNAASSPGKAQVPTIQRPVSAAPAVTSAAPADIVQPKPGCITLPQGKRWFAIAKSAGKTEDEMRSYLRSLGIEKSADMPRTSYDAAISWAQSVEPGINEFHIDDETTL